jgi:hypothetical protein
LDALVPRIQSPSDVIAPIVGLVDVTGTVTVTSHHGVSVQPRPEVLEAKNRSHSVRAWSSHAAVLAGDQRSTGTDGTDPDHAPENGDHDRNGPGLSALLPGVVSKNK